MAKGVYQTGPEFIQAVFSESKPTVQTLWLDQTRKQQAAVILDHPIHGFRVRYWQSNNTTAWILEEIGKELPITVGVVINNNQIETVKILTYRESRGGEVRFPSFLKQFSGGKLNTNKQLSSKIDGITGATLSVRAVKNTTRLALYYHLLSTNQ